MKNRYNIPGKAEAYVEWLRNGRLDGLISSINTARNCRGHGYGTKVLREIIADADKNGLALRLFPCPDDPKDYDRLVSWYKRHGFVQHEFSGIMHRAPQEPKDHG